MASARQRSSETNPRFASSHACIGSNDRENVFGRPVRHLDLTPECSVTRRRRGPRSRLRRQLDSSTARQLDASMPRHLDASTASAHQTGRASKVVLASQRRETAGVREAAVVRAPSRGHGIRLTHMVAASSTFTYMQCLHIEPRGRENHSVNAAHRAELCFVLWRRAYLRGTRSHR